MQKDWYERQQKLASVVNRCGVDMASITTDEDFVKGIAWSFQTACYCKIAIVTVLLQDSK